jgi:hypothetical protein
MVDHIIARRPDHDPEHYPDFSAAQADLAAELACLQEI